MEKKLNNVWGKAASVIILIGLLLGVYLSANTFSSPKEVPLYTGEVYLSSPGNRAFIDFLEAHDESVVYINATVREDLATPLHDRVMEDCENDVYSQDPFVGSITYIPVEIDKELPVSTWPPGINCFSPNEDGLFEDIQDLADCKNEQAILYSCPYYGVSMDSATSLPSSGGGTGLHSYFLTGFFTLKKTDHKESGVVFNLTEIEASAEMIHSVSH